MQKDPVSLLRHRPVTAALQADGRGLALAGPGRGQRGHAVGGVEEDLLERAGFAGRARGELLATGERIVSRTAAGTSDDLRPQERQIAELARDGLSNPEIGTRLFLSPRTVEWHLRHVFTKLGIRSRRELDKALPKADA